MDRPLVSLLVAVARNGVIGRDNALPWRLRSDLRRFKALTMGKPILMGRRTFDSIGKALPGRRSIVLTRDRGFSVSDVATVHDWEEALAAAADAPELVVIGGNAVFDLALPHANRIYLTEVEAAPEGDVVFPGFDRSRFRETLRQPHPAGEHDEHPFTYVDLERVDG